MLSLLLLLLACETPTGDVPVMDLYAARGAATEQPPWKGPWTPLVSALPGAERPAGALARALGARVVPPEQTPAAGELQAVVIPAGSAWKGLPPTPGARLLVLAPGPEEDARRFASAQAWGVAGVVDSAGELERLQVRPGAGGDPEAAMRAAARALAEAYGWKLTEESPPAGLPPGTRVALWGAKPEDAKHPAARVRAEAARRDPALAEALRRDPEPAVRLAAAAGVDSQESLRELARDAEPLVRARAASRVKDPLALAALAEDPSSLVRVVALHALVQLDVPQAEAALLRASRHGDAYVRWKASAGLRSVERLTELLGDADCDVRREAARRLGRLALPPAERERARGALETALGDANSFVRRWVAQSLGRLRDPSAIPALEGAARDPTGLVADAARGALQTLGRPLAPAGWRPPAPPRDEAALGGLLESPDATLRKDGAKFAAGRVDAVERLLPLGSDPDGEVRKSVAEALGRALARKADPRGEAHLARALSDPDPDTRITALDALRQLRRVPAAALPVVRESLLAADTEQRLRAAEALAGDPSVPSELLAGALQDPDERVRAAAVSRLPGRLTPGEPSALVRRAARAGAGALDGNGGDPDEEAWREGAWAREDDLLHLVFSWNLEEDRPPSHRALRPPERRAYGHPDRG